MSEDDIKDEFSDIIASPPPFLTTCSRKSDIDSISSLLTATYTEASARTLECEVASSLESSAFD